MEQERGILFETKDQSNKRRLKEAMERTPYERFIFFLKLCEEMQFFKQKEIHTNRTNKNFIIE